MSAIRTIGAGIPNNWRVPAWENNIFYPRGSYVRVDQLSFGEIYADIYFAHKDVPQGAVAPQLDYGSNYWTLAESGLDHNNYDSDVIALYGADSDIRLRLDSDFHYLRARDSEHDSDIRALRARDSEHDSDIRALRARDSELDSDIRYLYRNTMKLRGFVDFAARGPKGHKPKWGDVYIAYVSGTARIEWAGIAGTTIEPGQVVVYDDSEWRVVGGGKSTDSEHIRNIRSLYEQYTQTNTDLEQRRVKRGADSRSVFFEYDSDKSVLLFHDDGLDGPCLMDGANAPLGTVTTPVSTGAGIINKNTTTNVYTITGTPNGWAYIGINLIIVVNNVVVYNAIHASEPLTITNGGVTYTRGTAGTDSITYRENGALIGSANAKAVTTTASSLPTDINFSTSQFGPKTEMKLEFVAADLRNATMTAIAHASGTTNGKVITNLLGSDSEDQRLTIRVQITNRGTFIKGDKIIATHNVSGHKSVLEYDGTSAWRKWSLVNYLINDLDSETHDRKAADSDIHDFLDSEYRARKDADSDLNVRVDSEILARKDADSDIINHYRRIELKKANKVRFVTPTYNSAINYNTTFGTYTVTGNGNGWVYFATPQTLFILQKGVIIYRGVYASEPVSVTVTVGSGETRVYTRGGNTTSSITYSVNGVLTETSVSRTATINVTSHRYISYITDSDTKIQDFGKNIIENLDLIVDHYQNNDSDINARISSLHADAAHIDAVADVYTYASMANTIRRKMYISEKTNTLFFEIDSDKYYSVKPASDVIYTNLLEVTSNAKQLFLAFNGGRKNSVGTLVYESPRKVKFASIITGATGTISNTTGRISNFKIADVEKQNAYLLLDSEPSLDDTLIYIDSDSGLKSRFTVRRDYRQAIPTYVWRLVDEVVNVDSDIHRLYENDSELFKRMPRKYYNLVDSERPFAHTGTYGATMVVTDGVLYAQQQNTYDFYENGVIVCSVTPSDAIFKIRNKNSAERLVFRTTDGTKRFVTIGKYHNTFQLFVGVNFISYSTYYVGDSVDVEDWLYQRSLRHDSEIVHHYNGMKSPQARYYYEKLLTPVFTGTGSLRLFSGGSPILIANMHSFWIWNNSSNTLTIADATGTVVYTGSHTSNPTKVINAAGNAVFTRRSSSGTNAAIYWNNVNTQSVPAYGYTVQYISKTKKYAAQKPAILIDSDRNVHQLDSDIVKSFTWLAELNATLDSDVTKERHDRKAADSDIIEKFTVSEETITLIASQDSYSINDSELNKIKTWNFVSKITSGGSTYFGNPNDHFEVAHDGTKWTLSVDGVMTRSRVNITVTGSVSISLVNINTQWNGTSYVTIQPATGETTSAVAQRLYNKLVAIGVPGAKWTGNNVVSYFADGITVPTSPQTLNGLTFTYSTVAGVDTGFYYKDGDIIKITEK